MKYLIPISLETNSEQRTRLLSLRSTFAQVCNSLAPEVQQSRIWSRVALHHMHYYALRARFPSIGSQMICNAIYAVSKMAKFIYQHPKSPYNLARFGDKPLPLLIFAENCPVYFDAHTMSFKNDSISLFTMNGRIKFQIQIDEEHQILFERGKVIEILLKEQSSNKFEIWIQLNTEQKINISNFSKKLTKNYTQIIDVEKEDVKNKALSMNKKTFLPEYITLAIEK